jgi:transposase
VDTRTFVFKEPTMAKTRPPYAPEFRRQMVELVRAGRSPEELAREFEPTALGREEDPELITLQ